MTNHDVLDHAQRTDGDVDERTATLVDFLADEFPNWRVSVDATATWSGDARELWIARRDGHHPQSELTAGKLHRRLSDYEERESARRPGDN